MQILYCPTSSDFNFIYLPGLKTKEMGKGTFVSGGDYLRRGTVAIASFFRSQDYMPWRTVAMCDFVSNQDDLRREKARRSGLFLTGNNSCEKVRLHDFSLPKGKETLPHDAKASLYPIPPNRPIVRRP
ncbi:hypothetical protein [Cohnella sp. GbtcB17]|uniref:hypothetical protein n=1 Tax=Cohnella sp. GbtcB17 TaxID=2824762 RepID=UPI001C2F10F7|nr:hypothetical protein [Cohnella sp. GbtcB17]